MILTTCTIIITWKLRSRHALIMPICTKHHPENLKLPCCRLRSTPVWYLVCCMIWYVAACVRCRVRASTLSAITGTQALVPVSVYQPIPRARTQHKCGLTIDYQVWTKNWPTPRFETNPNYVTLTLSPTRTWGLADGLGNMLPGRSQHLCDTALW